jgi:hypothetical protein
MSESELFHYPLLDEEVIADLRDVRLAPHPPQRFAGNPVLRLDQSWERNALFGFMSVVFDADDQLFKAWYSVLYYNEKGDRRIGGALAYATSPDGITWAKPHLGLIEHDGSKANNLIIPILRSLHFRVILDQSELLPERKFKMLFYFRTAEMAFAGMFTPINVAYSSDGIHWTMPRWINPVIPEGTDALGLHYDANRRRYVAFLRPERNTPRWVCVSESADFVHWTPRRLILSPDEKDPPDGREFYGMVAAACDRYFVGLLEIYHTLHEGWTAHHPLPPDAPANWETVDIQLAFSRDGDNWKRTVAREPFIPVGEPGSWDAGMVFPGQAVLARGNETWIYYHGFGERHYDALRPGYRLEPQRSGCGLVKLAKDRFVAATATNEGIVTTQVLKVIPEALEVNAATQGAVRVELTTPFGRPVKGFTRQDCDPFDGDATNHRVTWRRNASMKDAHAEVIGGVVLRFYLERANLFAFSIAGVP